MRIREGDYAYDLEQKVDPLTQVRTGWKFTIFLVHPAEQVLERGEARTREEAENQALRAISRIRGSVLRGSSAA